MNVRRERGHNDLALRARNHVFDDRADVLFERREARHVGVGRVAHEEVEPLLADARKGAQVGQATIQGNLVHLEVARVQHRAGLGSNDYREGVGNRVVDRNELEVEASELLALTLGDDHRVRRDAVLFELGLDEGQRERRAEQRNVVL